jgi:hypothetical protein
MATFRSFLDLYTPEELASLRYHVILLLGGFTLAFVAWATLLRMVAGLFH